MAEICLRLNSPKGEPAIRNQLWIVNYELNGLNDNLLLNLNLKKSEQCWYSNLDYNYINEWDFRDDCTEFKLSDSIYA